MGKIEGKITNPTPPDYEKRREQERAFAHAKRKATQGVQVVTWGAGGMATGDMPPPPLNRAARRVREAEEKRSLKKKST